MFHQQSSYITKSCRCAADRQAQAVEVQAMQASYMRRYQDLNDGELAEEQSTSFFHYVPLVRFLKTAHVGGLRDNPEMMQEPVFHIHKNRCPFAAGKGSCTAELHVTPGCLACSRTNATVATLGSRSRQCSQVTCVPAEPEPLVLMLLLTAVEGVVINHAPAAKLLSCCTHGTILAILYVSHVSDQQKRGLP